MASTWSEQEIDTLKTMWAEGYSAGQIMRALGGGHSRNAVIGKVHRLGLAGRSDSKGVRTHSYPRERAKPDKPSVARDSLVMREARAKILSAPQPDAMRLEDGRMIGTADLRDSHCRWPHGDPGAPGFHYCGHNKAIGSSWCEFHKVRAAEKGHAPSPEAGALGRKAESAFSKIFGSMAV